MTICLPICNQTPIKLPQITCTKICVICLVMVFWPCVWRTIYVRYPKTSQANSVKCDFDDLLALLVTSIPEWISTGSLLMFMQNWPENYFRTLCWNWWHWKWTDCRPAGTCTSEWWPLKEQIIPTSEGMMRWSMMEKQDGVSSWWLLTFKYTLCTNRPDSNIFSSVFITVLPMGDSFSNKRI